MFNKQTIEPVQNLSIETQKRLENSFKADGPKYPKLKLTGKYDIIFEASSLRYDEIYTRYAFVFDIANKNTVSVKQQYLPNIIINRPDISEFETYIKNYSDCDTIVIKSANKKWYNHLLNSGYTKCGPGKLTVSKKIKLR